MGYFTKHAKSSAALVSLAVHAIIIVVAISFVAVTVIQKNEVDFKAQQVKRPKMNLKKLQVPVNVKKPPQQPKLRKQIVVAPKIAKVMPDLQMPEITGVKGGMGAGSGGFGGAASLGFSMPEINLFGVKSKGEKVFIILDSSEEMMFDEIGGIPAYELIKEEVLGLIGSLPPTAVFNISVYENWNTRLLFPSMVAANPENVKRAETWLKPLNAVRPDMGGKAYGVATLGPGGREVGDDLRVGKIESQELWYRPAMLAMKQQADTVFILTAWWGQQRIAKNDPADGWYETSAGKRWLDYFEKAKKMLEEENRQRRAEGRPPRVIRSGNPWDMIPAFFPDEAIERPPEPDFYYYTSDDFTEALLTVRKRYRPTGVELGVKKRKIDFSLNTVHFRKLTAEENHWRDGRTEENFKKLTSQCNGEYRALKGMAAIQSSVSR
jgi:hypothetical protein